MNINRELLMDFFKYYCDTTDDEYLGREEVIVDDYILFKKYPCGMPNPKEPETVHGNEAEKVVCKCNNPHLYQDAGFNWRCSLCGNPF
jgi:hypothetical protein